jgi:uncharacterized membrane protein YfcA
MSSVLTLPILFVAGAAAGALNSVAGGGSFIVLPTLLFTGVAPVTANATTTVALWPAGLGSLGAYRSHLGHDRTMLVVLAAMSAIGGWLGAKLLLVTSDETFAHVLPWLMLAAATVFSFGPRFARGRAGARLPIVFGALLQLVISTYGGYFGGGMGIMMLATFTLMGMTHMHQMNALKVILALLINGVALVSFLVAGKVVYAAVIPVALGAIFGGWAGASIARRVDPQRVRRLVLIVAWALTAWFFYRSLRR